MTRPLKAAAAAGEAIQAAATVAAATAMVAATAMAVLASVSAFGQATTIQILGTMRHHRITTIVIRSYRFLRPRFANRFTPSRRPRTKRSPSRFWCRQRTHRFGSMAPPRRSKACNASFRRPPWIKAFRTHTRSKAAGWKMAVQSIVNVKSTFRAASPSRGTSATTPAKGLHSPRRRKTNNRSSACPSQPNPAVSSRNGGVRFFRDANSKPRPENNGVVSGWNVSLIAHSQLDRKTHLECSAGINVAPKLGHGKTFLSGPPPFGPLSSNPGRLNMKLGTLQDLLVDELKDLYSAENQIIKALPKMVKKASAAELKKAFQEHLEVTREQAVRLEKVCKMLDVSPKGKKCKAMEGLLEEGKEVMSEDAEPSVMDAALIAAAQRVEHYEMAGYGCVRT